MRIVLVGEGAAGVDVLRRLVAADRDSVARVLTSDSGQGGGLGLAGAASRLGVPTAPAELVREPSFAGRLRAAQIDLLVNVHSLFVVHADVLAAPAIGSFNLHPGPLPEYAGLHSASWAIYHGEPRHGVTLHWMTEEVDAGAIAYRTEFAIEPTDTGLSLTTKCVRHGGPLVVRLLEDAARGGARGIPAVEQDRSRRRWLGAGPPEAGRLRWDLPARRIVDFVRACDYLPFRSPWGHPVTELAGRTLEIVKARPTGERAPDEPGLVAAAPTGIRVAALDEWVLVERVREGERYVDAAAAVSGADLVDR